LNFVGLLEVIEPSESTERKLEEEIPGETHKKHPLVHSWFWSGEQPKEPEETTESKFWTKFLQHINNTVLVPEYIILKT
jgi:hypothetical protein